MELVTFRTQSTAPEVRGREIGLRFSAEIARSAQLYLDLYRTKGIPDAVVARVIRGSREALADWDPEQFAELSAMAEAAASVRGRAGGENAGSGERGLGRGAFTGLDAVLAVTARTEVLATAGRAGLGECSTAVLLPPGNAMPWTLQTWDWYADLVPQGLVLDYTSAAGVGVRTFTEFGAPAKIGINAAGLGVHFNILHHASDHGGGGVPVHAVARRVLDHAQTVAEAVEIARSAPVSASSVLTVVTREPDAVSIELCPDGVGVVRPWTGGADPGTRVLLHTNHFLDPELARGDRATAKLTAERYAHLQARSHELTVPERAQYGAGGAVAGRSGQEPTERERRDAARAEFAAALCGPDGAGAPICMRPVPGGAPEEQGETLLTVSLDVERGEMDCFAGDPEEYARS
ncbi:MULTISPECIES: C45 family autoproteolytic acyltransferase/hydolase [Brevibacterium]|uniref:C45 family autoproteolytic acyltransferase/hydolase n=1 Tax=Brevibacterium salitolerans TaxID=1403566 RepID=A0ABN2WKA1_9MICO|nr:C45 family peptidase [Brevibacterium sp.]